MTFYRSIALQLAGYNIENMNSYPAIRERLETKLGLGPISTWSTFVFLEAAARAGLKITRNKLGTWFVQNARGRRFSYRLGGSNWNNQLASKIVRHKDVTSKYLQAEGIPSTKNHVFSETEIDLAWAWGTSFKSLVVKPATGLRGRNVHLDVTEKEHFIKAFRDVANAWENRVLVEEFHEGQEHRCLLVNGKFVAATHRRPASVVGDGLSAVRDLVDIKNHRRLPMHYQLNLEHSSHHLLSAQGLDTDSIVKRGERVFLTGISNLQLGGDALDATDELSSNEIAICENIGRALPGARLLGIDMLLPREGNEPGEPVVLEINLRPEISMHYFPVKGRKRDVGTAIIKAMFPNDTFDNSGIRS